MSLLEKTSDEPIEILFVDDDFEDYQLTEAMLRSGEHKQFSLNWSESFEAGLENLKDRMPDACLVDYHLGGQTGLDFVREAQARGFDGPIILLTGRQDDDLDQLALDAGAVDYLEKSTVNAALLTRSLRYAIHRKKLERELLFMASRDGLTGLRNRSSFDDEMKRVVSACARTGREAGLFLLDIDHFKRINDTLGHQVGDAVLKHTAARLKSCSRDIDIVSRWGGDEFAIIAENVGTVTDAASFARRIVEAVREPIHHEGTTVHATTSIGVLYCRPDMARSPDLLQMADQALYRAKSLGRDGFAFFDEAMNMQAERRTAIRTKLAEALNAGTLDFHGQPTLDVATGALNGIELLARPADLKGKPISADEVVKAADDNQLIWDVTRAAIAQAGHWHQKFAPDLGDDYRVSINLSAKQVRRSDTGRILRQMMLEANMPAQWIELELPESGLALDPVQARVLMQELKDIGFSLTLDNYTASSVPMTSLSKLPFDRIKLGQSLVGHVVDSGDIQKITACVRDLAESFGSQVIALGVEREEQSRVLAELGCTRQQGLLLAGPAPIGAVNPIGC